MTEVKIILCNAYAATSKKIRFGDRSHSEKNFVFGTHLELSCLDGKERHQRPRTDGLLLCKKN